MTITKVAFWNAGKETIRKGDTIAKNPLRIELKGEGEILAENNYKLSNRLRGLPSWWYKHFLENN